MRDLLKVAKENHFTIGAFNVTEVSNFNCVFEVAEELQSPTIIAVAVNELDFCEKEYYSYIREKLMNSRVPYCLHLDHGDSMKSCLRAIQSGFTSVMIDGSHLPFEENIAITKQVVDIAHLLNVSVEGELGTIGDLGNSDEGGAEKIIFTQPAEAKEFIDRTGVDTLAIAIGTSHGLYPEGFKPELQLDLLAKIVEKVDLPWSSTEDQGKMIIRLEKLRN
nr:class II fructose-bisphosphate aldolase [Erysipelothrix sp. HDW6A]